MEYLVCKVEFAKDELRCFYDEENDEFVVYSSYHQGMVYFGTYKQCMLFMMLETMM